MEIMAHEHGSFCFAELNTPDVELAKRFYRELLGWSAVDVPSAAGEYSLFQRHGKDVAGLRRVPHGPHRWVSHVLVESASRTAARAQALGATAIMPPFDVPGIARTCVLEDPEGAVLGPWEATGHQGARLIEETGTMWWVELLARDIVGAKRFYTSLLGWNTVETLKYGPPYTVFKLGDQSVSGAVEFGPDWGVTSRWQVFFAVDDYEAAVERATELGGLLEFARDVPHTGRLGVLRDAGHAVFVIMRPNQPRALPLDVPLDHARQRL
jgi:hypothetical protein